MRRISGQNDAHTEGACSNKVLLHVYDVGRLEQLGPQEVKTLNKFLRPLGSGAFHCGVEVYGREWSFKAEHSGTGVCSCRPRSCESHSFSDTLFMGTTSLSKIEVKALVKVLEVEWPGRSYDSLRRNCCHFCDRLSVCLGTGPLPAWITHLASAGAAILDTGEFLEKKRESLQASLCCKLCSVRSKRQSPKIQVIGPAVSPHSTNMPPHFSPLKCFTNSNGDLTAFAENLDSLEVGGGAEDIPVVDRISGDDVRHYSCSPTWSACTRTPWCAPLPSVMQL
mmetsp:Transcript_98499/g.195380  ORF Transcript_98499/g.195380 Transcript_98499/m.195380 type:complete len:280 (-) Transcript_98499:339-1178(-)